MKRRRDGDDAQQFGSALSGAFPSSGHWQGGGMADAWGGGGGGGSSVAYATFQRGQPLQGLGSGSSSGPLQGQWGSSSSSSASAAGPLSTLVYSGGAVAALSAGERGSSTGSMSEGAEGGSSGLGLGAGLAGRIGGGGCSTPRATSASLFSAMLRGASGGRDGAAGAGAGAGAAAAAAAAGMAPLHPQHLLLPSAPGAPAGSPADRLPCSYCSRLICERNLLECERCSLFFCSVCSITK
jgi:hypothetical protein